MPATHEMTEAELREQLRIANNELAHMVDLHPEEVCTIARLKVRIGHLECRLALLPMPKPSSEVA